MNIEDYTVENQMSWLDLDTWCGKMSWDVSIPIKEKISGPYSKKPRGSLIRLPLYLDLTGNGLMPGASWVMGGALLGEYTTQSFGESPNEGKECLLSQILEDRPPRKYYLSPDACRGILARTSKKGKPLQDDMRFALEVQIG